MRVRALLAVEPGEPDEAGFALGPLIARVGAVVTQGSDPGRLADLACGGGEMWIDTPGATLASVRWLTHADASPLHVAHLARATDDVARSAVIITLDGAQLITGKVIFTIGDTIAIEVIRGALRQGRVTRRRALVSASGEDEHKKEQVEQVERVFHEADCPGGTGS
jgi:hypothetical protein